MLCDSDSANSDWESSSGDSFFDDSSSDDGEQRDARRLRQEAIRCLNRPHSMQIAGRERRGPPAAVLDSDAASELAPATAEVSDLEFRDSRASSYAQEFVCEDKLATRIVTSEDRTLIHVPLSYAQRRGKTFRSRLLQLTQVFNASPSDVHRVVPTNALNGRLYGGADDVAERESNSSGRTASTGGAGFFVCRLNSTVAFQAAYRDPVTHPLSGRIAIADVLIGILLWLPVEQRTLLAVSGVSRGWRQVAARLPQWSLTPQLLHPEPCLKLIATSRCGATDTEFGGENVETRDDYMNTMHVRYRAKEQARIVAREGRCAPGVCYYRGRLHALVVALLVSACVTAVLAACFGIGTRGVKADVLNSDSKIGALCFFLGTMLGAGLTPHVLRWGLSLVKAGSARQRNLRRRPGWVAFLFTLVACVTLSAPAGLIGARLGQARSLEMDVLVLQPTGCAQSNATDSPPPTPRYIGVSGIQQWSIGGGPDCPRSGIDWLLEYSAAEPRGNFTCYSSYETGDGSRFRYVALTQPSAGWTQCPLPRRVAIAFEPDSADFDALVFGVFGVNASWSNATDVVTYFRTPTSTLWLQTGDTNFGNAWYANSSSPWGLPTRIALATAPASLTSPQGVTGEWVAVTLKWLAWVYIALVAVLVIVVAPRRCIPTTALQVMGGTMAGVALSPFVILGFGVKCAFFFSADVCLMTHAVALFLFVFGLVLSVLLVGFIVWFIVTD